MGGHRGQVVVRVRTIAENIAAAAMMSAAATAHDTATAAALARRRAGTHPLAGNSGALSAAEVMTAVGTASALRETALATARRAALAEQTLEDSKRDVRDASAQRKAAERLVERRMAVLEADDQRRRQRVLDEGATLRLGLT